MSATTTDVTKSDALSQALKELGLSEFLPKLLELGVTQTSDVTELSDLDLTGIGLTTVQMRKLQGACSINDEDDECFTWSVPLSSPANIPLQLVRTRSCEKRQTSKFWLNQLNRPNRFILIRHGESEANVHRDITCTVPDHMLHLTAKGRAQALAAGRRLKNEVVKDESVRFIVSPYVRALETFNGIRQAWGDTPVDMRTDVRIREQEFGNYDSEDMKSLHQEKKAYGPFYFRFPDGESPADCYDRASAFLESLYRSWEDNTISNYVVVGHGMMNLMIVMRLLRFSIEEWESWDALSNCEFVVMRRPPDDGKFRLQYTWADGKEPDKSGLLRKKPAGTPVTHDTIPIWDGSDDAPLLTSEPRRQASSMLAR